MADTRRDIIQRVKVNGEAAANKIARLGNYVASDPAAAGSAQKDIVDTVNANISAMSTAMAAYAAAAT